MKGAQGMKNGSRIFLLACGLAWAGGTAAADNMRFSGTLIEPPACSINDGGMVDVDFGDRVGVKKVDGKNYLQPVYYQITCEQGTGGWAMTLEVVGSAADFDSAAIASNVDNLAIRLLQDGKAFELNKPIAIQLNAPPQLEAVPVKRAGSELSEGAFEATATLQAVYQ